jgi:hypothetical protein
VRRVSFGSDWAANREEYPRMRSEAKHFSMSLFFEGKRMWPRRSAAIWSSMVLTTPSSPRMRSRGSNRWMLPQLRQCGLEALLGGREILADRRTR